MIITTTTTTTTDHLILARRPDLAIVGKKKRTCWIVYLAIAADHRAKITENRKRD